MATPSGHDYAQFRQLREQEEIAQFQQQIAGAERGETTTLPFTNPDDMYRYFGVTRKR